MRTEVLACAIGVAIASSPAAAAIYYVDYESGMDTNDGMSTATAWQHVRGMTGATSNAAAAVFVPGDVIYFKAGVTWPASTLPFAPSHDGAAGSPITYAKHPSWGTGAYFTLDGGGTAVRCIGSGDLDNRHHIVLDGFDCTSFASSSATAGALIYARQMPDLVLQRCRARTGGSNYIVYAQQRVSIIDCILDGTNATGADGAVTLQFGSTNLDDPAGHGSILRGNDITAGGKEYGVKIYNCKDCVVEKNYLHGYTNPAGYLLVHRTSHGATFRYNVIDATGLGATGIAFNMWHGSGSTPDPDRGNKVYNNTLIGGGVGVCMAIQSPNWDGHELYNNLCYAFGIGLDSEGDVTAVHNNLFAVTTLYNGSGARIVTDTTTTDPMLTAPSILPGGATPILGSPMIGSGFAFDSYHDGNHTDFAGTLVPAPPSRGAFEHSSNTGAPPPQAPSDLRVQ